MSNFIQQISNFLFPKKEELHYPNNYVIIDWSEASKIDGIDCNENKVIERHFVNRFGNRDLVTYPYSEVRLHSILKVHKIPFFDLTEQPRRIRFYSRIQPDKIKYIKDIR